MISQVTRRLAWLRHLEMLLAIVAAGLWMAWASQMAKAVDKNDKSSWKEICQVWQALFRIDIIERFKSFLDSSMIFHEMRRERPAGFRNIFDVQLRSDLRDLISLQAFITIRF